MQNIQTCQLCDSLKLLICENTEEKEYLNTVRYLDGFIQRGIIELQPINDELADTCLLNEISKMNPKPAHWISDLIRHSMKCKECGSVFELVCDTYRGVWWFKNV